MHNPVFYFYLFSLSFGKWTRSINVGSKLKMKSVWGGGDAKPTSMFSYYAIMYSVWLSFSCTKSIRNSGDLLVAELNWFMCLTVCLDIYFIASSLVNFTHISHGWTNRCLHGAPWDFRTTNQIAGKNPSVKHIWRFKYYTINICFNNIISVQYLFHLFSS